MASRLLRGKCRQRLARDGQTLCRGSRDERKTPQGGQEAATRDRRKSPWDLTPSWLLPKRGNARALCSTRTQNPHQNVCDSHGGCWCPDIGPSTVWRLEAGIVVISVCGGGLSAGVPSFSSLSCGMGFQFRISLPHGSGGGKGCMSAGMGHLCIGLQRPGRRHRPHRVHQTGRVPMARCGPVPM